MSLLLAMCLFSLTMSISPGPVNLITLTTGVNYGFKNAMPFVSGATIGFTLLLLFIGLGIGGLASTNDGFLLWLGLAGATFMGYMGYKLVVSKPELDINENHAQREVVQKSHRPYFHQGFLLQWLNPKAWIACVSGVSAFNLSDSLPLLLTFVSLYFVICYASIASWAIVGDKIKGYLTQPKNLQVFNWIMGSALIAVAVYLLYLQIIAIS